MKYQLVGLIPPEDHEQIRQSLAAASRLATATRARIREIKTASKVKPTQEQKRVKVNARGVHLG